MNSVTLKDHFSSRFLIVFIPLLKNKTKKNPRANVTVHIFLLKVVTGIVRSRKESEMLTDWPEKPAEEGWDWECPWTVTWTELGLKQQKHRTSKPLGRQGEGENQQHELKRCRIISLCPCGSVDPCLQSLTIQGTCKQLSSFPLTWYLDAEIPHINTGWLCYAKKYSWKITFWVRILYYLISIQYHSGSSE